MLAGLNGLVVEAAEQAEVGLAVDPGAFQGLVVELGDARGAEQRRRALTIPDTYLHAVSMATAKLFQHGGSQAVRLPRAFRFEGTEVEIEKRGHEVVLRPKPKPRLKTLADVARFMQENFPEARDFPDCEEQPLSPIPFD